MTALLAGAGGTGCGLGSAFASGFGAGGFAAAAGRGASGFASTFGSGFTAIGFGAVAGLAVAGFGVGAFAAAGAWAEVPASLLGGDLVMAGFAEAALGADFNGAGVLASGAGLAAVFVLAGGAAAFLRGAGTLATLTRFAAGLAAAFVAGLALAVLALRRAVATFLACAAGRPDLPAPLPEVGRLLDPLARTGAFIPDESPAAGAACGLTPGTSAPAGHSQDLPSAWAGSGSPCGCRTQWATYGAAEGRPPASADHAIALKQ